MAERKKIAVRPLPVFVPAELSAREPAFTWRIGWGAMHMGPPHTANALYKKLGKTETYCGSLALLAGTYAWGISRFANVRDLTPYLDLYELMFLLMEPERFLDVDFIALDAWKRVNSHAFDDALNNLKHLALQAIWPGSVLDRGGCAPNLFQMVHLVRHLIGATWRKPFDRWLDTALARCMVAGRTRGYKARVGHTARARTWGFPVTPTVLVADAEVGASKAKRAAFVASVEWKRNRFFKEAVGRFASLGTAHRKALRAIGLRTLVDAKRIKLDRVKAATDTDGMGFLVATMMRLELAEGA